MWTRGPINIYEEIKKYLFWLLFLVNNSVVSGSKEVAEKLDYSGFTARFARVNPKRLTNLTIPPGILTTQPSCPGT